MTLKQFFTGRALVLLILFSIGLGVFAYKMHISPSPIAVAPTPVHTQTTEPRTFTWRYEKANSLNPDGNPNTDVFLDVGYTDGGTRSILVITSHGGCNDLVDSKEVRVVGTTVAQCYGAGAGYYLKITKVDGGYQVKRKTFEEGSPEYTPPEQSYEVILEIN